MHFRHGGGWDFLIDAPLKLQKREACEFPPRTTLTSPAWNCRLPVSGAAGAEANSLLQGIFSRALLSGNVLIPYAQVENLFRMQTKPSVLLSLLGVLSFFIAGCASGPSGVPEPRGSTSSVSTQPGKVGVYFIADDRMVALGRYMAHIIVDGPTEKYATTINWSSKEEGQRVKALPWPSTALRWGYYTKITLAPGRHHIGTAYVAADRIRVTPNPPQETGKAEVALGHLSRQWPSVQMEAGRNYYFRIKDGWSSLEAVELQESEAQSYINKRKFCEPWGASWLWNVPI
jgi:hypothetical protein